MSVRFARFVLCAAPALLLLAGCTGGRVSAGASEGSGSAAGAGQEGHGAAAAAEGRSLAEDFTLKDAEGREHTLSEHRGRVVLLDFWATWCPPCRKSMPTLQALHERFADRGVDVVGIAINEPGATSAKYMRDKSFDYGLLVDGDPVARRYGVQAIPTLVVVDRQGRVALRETGVPDRERLAGVLETLLAEG